MDQDFEFRWISGKRLMERWGLVPNELVELCRYCTDEDGIQPYYEVPDHIDVAYVKYGDEDPLYYGLMSISSDKELKTALFKTTEIRQYEKAHPDIKPFTVDNDTRFPTNGILIDGTASKKLRIAAAAHQGFYKSGAWMKCRTGDIAGIKSWIGKHYPEIEETVKGDIAKIINKNPDGSKKDYR